MPIRGGAASVRALSEALGFLGILPIQLGARLTDAAGLQQVANRAISLS